MYHRIGTSGAQPYCCCLARVVKTRNRAFLAAQHRCPGSPEPAVYSTSSSSSSSSAQLGTTLYTAEPAPATA